MSMLNLQGSFERKGLFGGPEQLEAQFPGGKFQSL